MGRTRISLRGDRVLAKQLRTLRSQTDEIVTDTLRAWGDDVRDTARSLAPKRTGRLQRGITVQVRGRIGRASVGTHRGPFYGHLVENGTSHSPAQPFLQPAFHRHTNLRRYVRTAVSARLP